MSAHALPTTLAAWERGLVDRFLRASDSGDASPLRCFEITGETLATVFPDADATAEEAEEAFRNAVRADPQVFHAFRAGTPRLPGTSTPECFGYLCASLLILTLLDGTYLGQGQFRDRLRIWLGTSRTMMQLTGIARMWHDLKHWLDDRVAAGEPFRTLVLPDPRTWTQIGHTRRLSFPTRADVRFLEKAWMNFPRGAFDPPGFIRSIDAAIERDGASWGMESAFAEFRDAFRGGGASTEHRFWRLVLKAEPARAVGYEASRAQVEIEFDQDGRPGFSVDGIPSPTLASAMRAPLVARSANLGSATQRGIVFFRQAGMARWVAEAEPPPGAVYIGVAPALAAFTRGTAADFSPSGDWLFTGKALRPGAVDDLLARFRLSRLRRERLIDVSVEGGVNTDGGMLGRRRFLPRIVAAGRATAIRGVAERGIAPPQARSLEGQIAAEAHLDGSYELSVYTEGAGDAPEWRRRVRFLRDAVPHSDTGGAAEKDQLIWEWIEDGGAAHETVGQHSAPAVPEGWDEEQSGIADLLEAVYAAGRSGLDDADLIDLVSRAGAPAPVWDVLRSIQEAGFVVARRRARWRGRSWTLEPPTLTSTFGCTLLEGATCAALQEEFRQVAAVVGGAPFRGGTPSAWSPPIVGAANVEPSVIADMLGWPVRATTCAWATGASALERSQLLATDHVPVSSWDWVRRRFVTGSVALGDVSITRWAHPGGRDHDQYRVRWPGGEARHATRNAAILQGHLVGVIPLFTFEEGVLVRTAAEGALPVEIARRLRATTIRASGPCADGGYAYPADAANVLGLDRAFPGCIAGLPARPAALQGRLGPAAALASARRDGGRTRPRWRDGGICAA